MSNLRQLKENFDRVLIKYSENSCEVLIVDGLNVFAGQSKCHDNDSFDRKLGRTIALGRAEHAFNVNRGAKLPRENSCFQDGSCKSSGIACADTKQVDEIIIRFLPTRKSQETA